MLILHRINGISIAILLAYFAVSVLIGWIVRKKCTNANDFLNATGSLPLWIVSLAFLAANCGALDIIGLSAMSAQYGVQAFQFFWIGAIPGMIFVALWMLPQYVRMGIRSVPEYLEQRYDKRVKLVNACTLAVTTIVFAGINLYAIGQTLQALIGIPFFAGALLAATIVSAYVLLGGLRATIYNEALQLLIILAGLFPLLLKLRRVGSFNPSPNALRDHLWTSLPFASTKAPFDDLGTVIGLGFVLGFGYWCTDFVLMQRALAARGRSDARKVPLLAGFGKILVSFLVVLPAAHAARFLPGIGKTVRYDAALPEMMARLYSPSLLGLGMTALVAGLMSGLAANVSAFAAIWTEDIYRAWLVTERSESHYLKIGAVSTIGAMLLGLLASETSFRFSNLMEHVQLVLSVFGPPFWAIFLLGIATTRVNARAAFGGLASGITLAIVHDLLVLFNILRYGSVMTANFHVAIYGFSTSFVIALLLSCSANPHLQTPGGYRNGTQRRSQIGEFPIYILAGLLALACVSLNWIWR